MPLLHLKTRRVEYKLEINGKYTILRGDSGTGKTTLYELIGLYSADPASALCPGYHRLITLDLVDINDPDAYKDYIIIADEDNIYLHKYNTASILKSFECWFIFITRTANFNYLPIDLDNILRIKTSGKFHTAELFYPKDKRHENLGEFDLILCEDSNSGY